eukprot:gene7605-22436_t
MADDIVSVLTFSTRLNTLFSHAPIATVNPLLNGQPGGGTLFKPALTEAHRLFQNTPWNQRHPVTERLTNISPELVFMTDGENADGDITREMERMGEAFAA